MGSLIKSNDNTNNVNNEQAKSENKLSYTTTKVATAEASARKLSKT